jgi:uncharacterized damage-inducible protein DinB
MNELVFRQSLVAFLRKGQAHVTVTGALKDLPAEARGRRPSPALHSVFEELEHLRIAQEDILRYTLDAGWRSPEFPKGYWPDPELTVTDAVWNKTVEGWKADLAEVVALAEDTSRDLTAAIPHGEGRTYLRQVLLVADHNAYHAAQIVAVRKLLGNWGTPG